MNQGVSHEVKTNLFGQRSCLLDDLGKEIEIHHFFGTNDLGAKAALKIANIADLDVYFLKSFLRDSQSVKRSTRIFRFFKQKQAKLKRREGELAHVSAIRNEL